jgi:hypothetical protein
MLSIKQCRKIDPQLMDLSDKELGNIRDCLYALGELAIKDLIRDSGSKIPLGIAKSKPSEYD